ncbi:MAG: methionyl-tRNA formyltransferase [Planctomycetaceae bacterium]|nr:methionyl-tRNA formyltransferase [Planctomycetaceae bacterium]
MALKLLMMGTGAFALPSFKSIIASPHDVVGLVTQPDKTGRGHHRHFNVMKAEAEAAGIPVFQPENANATESILQLREFGADLFVVAAYGQILSSDLIEIPRLGAINLHGSLLPKYRGAAPIQYAVWNGESETGVTIFQIEPKLDAGTILGKVASPIAGDDTSGTVHDRLAELAGPLAIRIIDEIEAGTVSREPQDPHLVTKAPKLRKDQGLIDWTKTAREVDCQIRAMQPWPMPFTFLSIPGKPPIRIFVLKVAACLEQRLAPGELRAIGDEHLVVGTGDSALEIVTLQPAGKRPMPAADFLRGTSVDGAFLTHREQG